MVGKFEHWGHGGESEARRTCERSTVLEQPTRNHSAAHSEECAKGDGDHSIRRSFDGSNWGGGPIRRQQRNTGVFWTWWKPNRKNLRIQPTIGGWGGGGRGGGPYRSCTHGTNWTQRMVRTWEIRPTTDCKEGTEAHNKRKNGQGMSHGMAWWQHETSMLFSRVITSVHSTRNRSTKLLHRQ